MQHHFFSSRSSWICLSNHNISTITHTITQSHIHKIAYRVAIFQLNILPSMINTISFTRGDVTRNDRATPSGIRDLRNQINIGIDEQEQNGVITQRKQANKYDVPNRPLSIRFLSVSLSIYDSSKDTTVMMMKINNRISIDAVIKYDITSTSLSGRRFHRKSEMYSHIRIKIKNKICKKKALHILIQQILKKGSLFFYEIYNSSLWILLNIAAFNKLFPETFACSFQSCFCCFKRNSILHTILFDCFCCDIYKK